MEISKRVGYLWQICDYDTRAAILLPIGMWKQFLNTWISIFRLKITVCYYVKHYYELSDSFISFLCLKQLINLYNQFIFHGTTLCYNHITNFISINMGMILKWNVGIIIRRGSTFFIWLILKECKLKMLVL